ncbi:transcriptional regulator [Neisseria animalis]|uniref:Transcriptional regulator n=1 Tax=Neisseria animalis TaxID=492 RepID=A0A5P3MTP5_NEIAN|nr:transcriptional regulator [Neisseria animalis]ROW32008.1 transcriptional regulator [Neisseria animalis]
MRPSHFLRCASAVLHMTAAAICLTCFYGIMMWAGLAALSFSAFHAWRVTGLKHTGSVHKIAVNPQLRAAIFIGQNQTAWEAILLDSSTVTANALFLHWDTGSRKIWHAVLPDMADDESYRRLRVWVRWCQTKDNTAPLPSAKDDFPMP